VLAKKSLGPLSFSFWITTLIC